MVYISSKRYKSLISDVVIRNAVHAFGVVLSSEQVDRVRCFLGLLLRWNQRVNLTSVRDPREILGRHFGESMFAGQAVPIEVGRLADVGSGAGFPGLAVKILRPLMDVVLIEPNVRKSAFLREVIGELGLRNIRVVRSRMEEAGVGEEQFDFLTARAVGKLEQLLEFGCRVLQPAGRLVLWLGREQALELGEAGGWHWRPLIPIPGSKRRVLLIGDLLKTNAET